MKIGLKMDRIWILDELFGENRAAIEVFPKAKKLVDVMDVYHLWVFPKEFEMPFGIHPTRDEQCRWIRRGCPKDISRLVENGKGLKSLMGQET